MKVSENPNMRPKTFTIPDSTDPHHMADLLRIKNFRLLDDDFFTKCFEGDTKCIELILRIILNKPDLNVFNVRTQVFVENLLNRSVRLDVLASDSLGRIFNIEIQRADKGAGRRRARYNSSMLDANLLEKGAGFDMLPETFVIFITENDIFKKGEPFYQIERCFVKTGEPFEDGAHILYVNGAYQNDSPLGKLMHDFACSDPSDMYYDVLADRVRFFKEEKEGIAVMCKAMEDMRRESMQEGIKEGISKGMKSAALRMLNAGKYTIDEIVSISGLSLEEIQKLKAKDMN